MTAGTTAAEIVALLTDEAGVAPACERVDTLAKSGHWEELVGLAKTLEARCDPADPAARGRFELVCDHVEDELAFVAEDGAVDALLTLSQAPRVRSVTVPRSHEVRVRAFASRLGFGQPKEAFLAALARFGETNEHQELLACWMHEVVLRGTSLSAEARARAFHETVLVAPRHPLAFLPLELHPVEREAPTYMPLYGDKGLGRAVEALASGAMSVVTVPPPADGAAVRVKRVEEPGVIDRMTSAVRPWVEGTRGKVEAKIFALDPAVPPAAAGRFLLRALPLDATTAAARLESSRTGPEGAFGPLFSAASNGGAYSSGLGGAYGRRAAWTSFAALVGASGEGDVDAVGRLAADSAFLTFRAPGPWFYDVAWDLGVLVVRPDGRTAAVLSATDTD